MKYVFSLFLVLVAVWLGWSGHFTPLLIVLGLASCVAVLLIGRRMGMIDGEGVPIRLGLRLAVYLPWLTWEIVKANLDVARRILRPGLPISPRIVRVKPRQESTLGRVIYANSITLTPGTLSLHVDDDEIVVHALSRSAAEDLVREPGMNRRVVRLEGGR